MKNFYQLVSTGFLLIILLSFCTSESETNTEEKKEYNASVFFKNLTDGDTLISPFTVEMGVEGMYVEPAGNVKEGFGHHHIIVNCTHIDTDNVIPSDKKHIHFGQGETETDLELEAGNYCLTLQFADGFHKSYGEELSKTINIVVE